MATNNMYLYSLIARAAYCDFNNGMSFKDALQSTGVFKFYSDVMVNDLVPVLNVIYQYNDPITGFSL